MDLIKKIVKWTLLSGGGVLLLFLIIPFNFNEVLINPLESSPVDELEYYDLGVVLGAGVEKDSTISNLAKERVDHAVEQSNAKGFPLLFTGGVTPYGTESVVMSDYAKSLGYEKVTYIEESSTSTYENAKLSAELIEGIPEEVNIILVLTSPFHTRRALATFKKAMPDKVIQISSPDEAAVLSNTIKGRLKGLYMITREYVAIIYYKIRFGI